MNIEQVYFLIIAGVMLLFGFPVHEFSHAFAADRLGDRTARYLGRLSLDPRRHFDPVGGLVLIITAVNVAWLLAGAALTRFFRDPRTNRMINVAFAILLVASVALALAF